MEAQQRIDAHEPYCGDRIHSRPLRVLTLEFVAGGDAAAVHLANGIIIKRNLCATVRSLSADEFREHCFVRLALESFAAGLTAQLRREADLREL